MTATAMRFHSPPVINSLKNVFAIFVNFQLDHNQSPVMTQREQIDWARATPRSNGTAVRRPELCVQRRDDQARIEFRYVATQKRFQPCFTRRAIKPLLAISAIIVSIDFQILEQL